ncbi:TrbC/VirB2 family protein [Phenylobacterium sp. LjRoot219]|uniref:TrbC/VirB2 family protein n=1 Tax=Phenylobacterium sp. LjRoot219 TaxID=3342283 RepID=UPI003ECC6CE8
MTSNALLRTSGTLALAAIFSAALCHPAFAQSVGGVGGNIEGFLQNVVDLLTGNVARLLAVIAVVLVGIAWMFGQMDLRRAGVVIIGIILIFGAVQIVSMITGGGGSV